MLWTDQPKACENAAVLFHGRVGERSVEVMESTDGSFLVTQGNLFGSETVRVPDMKTMFQVMQLFADAPKNARLPPGCTILPNQ